MGLRIGMMVETVFYEYFLSNIYIIFFLEIDILDMSVSSEKVGVSRGATVDL